MSELRQHLIRCARPSLLARCFLWIFNREILRSLPETREYFVRQIGIIDSMTPAERATPELISVAREDRIAQGAGVRPEQVRRLLQMFDVCTQQEPGG